MVWNELGEGENRESEVAKINWGAQNPATGMQGPHGMPRAITWHPGSGWPYRRTRLVHPLSGQLTRRAETLCDPSREKRRSWSVGLAP